MKRILLSICIISTALFSSFGQNSKAEKEAAALANFEKAVAVVETKDFVIIVDSYMTGDNFETNTDNSNFMSYEKDFVYLQGLMVSGNAYTNKLTVSDFAQVPDKKGNIKVSMQVRGFYINAKIEISLKKTAGSNADVIVTPVKGDIKRFSGEVVPRAESKYFKRSGEV
jgi:Domain of unknown function (DUF4251)